MNMIGKYFLDTHDAFVDFGLVFKRGVHAQLLSLPNAWPDEKRSMSLPIILMAANEIDFWSKYNALRIYLTSGDDIILYAKDLHRRFKVTYTSMSSFKNVTVIKSINKVASEFILNLDDDYPDVKLATRTQDFISTVSGETVSFTRIYSSYSLADANAMKSSDTEYTADGQAYADGYVNSGITPIPPVPVDPQQLTFTCATYAEMLVRIAAELPGILYKYSIKHDEVYSGGFPAEYRRCDGQFIRLVPQQAII